MSGNGKYDIGYGKPPVSGQFKKGQSGNPRGRPKGKPTLDGMVEKLLSQFIAVTADGKQKYVRRDEALILSAYAKALKGDSRSMKLLIDIIARRQAAEPPNNFMTIRLVKPEK